MENPGVLVIRCNKFVLTLRTEKLLKKEELLGFSPKHSGTSPDVIRSHHVVLHFVAMSADLEGHAVMCLSHGISLSSVYV